MQSWQRWPRCDRGRGAGRRAAGEPGLGARGDAGCGSPLHPRAALRIFLSVAGFTLSFLLFPLGTMHKSSGFLTCLFFYLGKGVYSPQRPHPKPGAAFPPPPRAHSPPPGAALPVAVKVPGPGSRLPSSTCLGPSSGKCLELNFLY